MLQRYLLLLGLLAATGRLAAQAQTYEPGYLVRSTGDTLRGEIENAHWAVPPTYVRFRTTADAPAERFVPRQLRAVRLQGGRYFRYEALAIDHAATNLTNELPRGNLRRVQTDSVLAEVLLDGPVTLLRVVLPGSTHYVLQRPGRPPLELAERRYLSQQPQGDWRLVEGNDYRNQLRLYLLDCPAASRVVTTAPFTAEGLAAVAQAYAAACSEAHQPAQSWVAPAQAPRRLALQGGVLAGLRYNRLDNVSYQAPDGCVDCLPHPSGGFYLEVLPPGRTGAIYAELSISNFRGAGADYYNGSYNQAPTVTTFAYSGLLATARLGVRYLPLLPHGQQLVFGLTIERNHTMGVQLPPATTGLRTPAPDIAAEDYFPSPTMLPGLTAGWRKDRLSVLLDWQAYYAAHGESGPLLSSSYGLRLSAAYQLGQHADTRH